MEWIFTVLVVVFAGDTGALYAGTFWGRHKLAPAISPGKTIEGSCGGLICNLLAGSLLNAWLLPSPLPWPAALAFFRRRQGFGAPAARARRHPGPHRCAAVCRAGGLCLPLRGFLTGTAAISDSCRPARGEA
jgi:hypothetical protein